MITEIENETTIESWSELMEVLAEDTNYLDRSGRHRNEKVYRGMADVSWELLTSLQGENKNYRQVERHLLRNFQKIRAAELGCI